jgi:iron-regulated transporter 1
MAARRSKQATPDESTPLIVDLENVEVAASTLANDEGHPQSQISTRITYRLYISHFLSTWNSRVFEFGAVLYLATVYPGTLLPMSAYALSRGFVAIIFSSAVGYYIDVGNRLQVVRVSIGQSLGSRRQADDSINTTN